MSGSTLFKASSCSRSVRNVSDLRGPGKLLIVYTPANRIEEFFRGRTEGSQYSTDAARYRAYGLELLGPPLQID